MIIGDYSNIQPGSFFSFLDLIVDAIARVYICCNSKSANLRFYLPAIALFILLNSCSKPSTREAASVLYHESYRPQFHFSPPQGWMNDPNGMVFLNGQYHLFYQHYPDSIVWGPMHWGHALSSDLVHWKNLPIVLYPDSLGYIFSGSAVVDMNNTSGFGTNGQPPVVAIFTQHLMEGEKAGRSDYQTQSIAYSLDQGETWKMYDGNPVRVAKASSKSFAFIVPAGSNDSPFQYDSKL